MIHSLVFSVWISILSLKDQEAELALEEDAKAELVLNTELANKKLWNGSRRNMMEPFTIDQIFNIQYLFKSYVNSIYIRYTVILNN
jgi:hypothetical protein